MLGEIFVDALWGGSAKQDGSLEMSSVNLFMYPSSLSHARNTHALTLLRQ